MMKYECKTPGHNIKKIHIYIHFMMWTTEPHDENLKWFQEIFDVKMGFA